MGYFLHSGYVYLTNRLGRKLLPFSSPNTYLVSQCVETEIGKALSLTASLALPESLGFSDPLLLPLLALKGNRCLLPPSPSSFSAGSPSQKIKGMTMEGA